MTHNDNDFIYQLELQQLILKVLIYKMKSDIGSEIKHDYESKNENDKMLQKTQERLDQTSRCKRNLKTKHSLKLRVKAVLDVYSVVTKRRTAPLRGRISENLRIPKILNKRRIHEFMAAQDCHTSKFTSVN